MPTTFTNNWKNILDKLESIIKTEFKGTLPVCIGFDDKTIGSQYLRLIPIKTDLLEYNATAELREFTIEIILQVKTINTNKGAIHNLTRMVSRIESLITDNISMTLSDSSNAINCRVNSTTFESSDQDGSIVSFDYKCQHLGNVG